MSNPAQAAFIERTFTLSDGMEVVARLDEETADRARDYRDDLLINRGLSDDTSVLHGQHQDVLALTERLAHGSTDKRYLIKMVEEAVVIVMAARQSYKSSAQAEALMLAMIHDSLFEARLEGKVTKFVPIRQIEIPANAWDDSSRNARRDALNLPPFPVRKPTSITEQKLVYMNELLALEPLFQMNYGRVFQDALKDLTAQSFMLSSGAVVGREDGQTDAAGFRPDGLAGNKAGQADASAHSQQQAAVTIHKVRPGDGLSGNPGRRDRRSKK